MGAAEDLFSLTNLIRELDPDREEVATELEGKPPGAIDTRIGG